MVKSSYYGSISLLKLTIAILNLSQFWNSFIYYYQQKLKTQYYRCLLRGRMHIIFPLCCLFFFCFSFVYDYNLSFLFFSFTVLMRCTKTSVVSHDSGWAKFRLLTVAMSTYLTTNQIFGFKIINLSSVR